MSRDPAKKDVTRRKKVRVALGCFWFVYLGMYLVLTLNGSYRGPYPASGAPERVEGTEMVKRAYIWKPLHVRFDTYGYNWLGAVYCPLVLIDRLIWHRDRLSFP